MNDYNQKKEEEKKGGFGGLLRGASSATRGTSGFGSAGSAGGGLGGLFATKAGIVGMVLGGATIAAGIGVVYNFIGPSSKPAYSPELFQNSYYEEESAKAGLERTQTRSAAQSAASTLDMFREQAKKDGIGLASGEEGAEKNNASAEDPSAAAGADAAAQAPSADAGASGAAGEGAPKLQAAAGFGSKAGGASSGTSIPRMQTGGGLSGGIGAQFQPVYRPPVQANSGKTSGMGASAAARIGKGSKYSVPSFNKKGAYGQAKYAQKMGLQSKSSYGVSSKSAASVPFDSGSQTGSGDVATAGTGAGLGGAGISNGQSLKANDPSLSSNESKVPDASDSEDVDPWQKYEDMAMKGMMWATGLILVTKLLSGIAKKMAASIATLPYAAAVFYAAMATAAMAIMYALKAVFAGYKMYSTYGQKMMGGIYMLAGIMLVIKAVQALMEAYKGAQAASKISEGTKSNGFIEMTDKEKSDWLTKQVGSNDALKSSGKGMFGLF